MTSVKEPSARRFGSMAAGLLLTLLCGSAMAQGRIVFVNGELLDDAGLAVVDQLNCGTPLPNGNYWLDLANGVWGYVGSDDRYALPDCTAAPGQSASPAPAEEEGDCESKDPVHEDRMCYCYHVC
jgi:hypothetical protein